MRKINLTVYKKIKKAMYVQICILLAFFCLAFAKPVISYAEEARRADNEIVTAQDWPEAPDISAEAAVLIEADSGTVLYTKNGDSKRFPASITKILTALITLENHELDETMVYTGEALMPLPDGYVSIEPTEGEEMSVEDGLYGLLLYSANDAANGLAVHDAGTIAAFAQKMNERAAKAGALHTHFSNPSGLFEETHYTTPYDMAMIMRDCIKNKEFLKIAGSLTYTIPATNTHEERVVEMRHQMLQESSANYYEYCVAGKTGFTTPSGFTLITYAEKDGMKLIACVMQCAENGQQYQSTRALFDYGFENFSMADETSMNHVRINTDSLALNQLQGNPSFVVEHTDYSSLILPEGVNIFHMDTEISYLNPEENDGCFAEIFYSHEGMALGSSKIRIRLSESAAFTELENLNSTEILQKAEQQHRARMMNRVVMLLSAAGLIVLILLAVYRSRRQKKLIMEAINKKELLEKGGIDYEAAKAVFEQYLDGYDRNDDKIKLKIVHTYGVVECSREIAVSMGLSKEDTNLAMLIALLHDIGRFEQIKRYQSFEPATMDHAVEGAKILFETGLIRKFIQTTKYDEIIRVAIARHSDFKLGEIPDERCLLHARLIRDADKLDNYRVKLEDSIEVLLGKSAEEVGQEEISEKIFDAVCAHKSIYSSDRQTAMDYWVSYIAYTYDINFKETLKIIFEKNYISDIINRIPYANEETEKKMKQIEKDILEYISKADSNPARNAGAIYE